MGERWEWMVAAARVLSLAEGEGECSFVKKG
jgi:hypothetical protein